MTDREVSAVLDALPEPSKCKMAPERVYPFLFHWIATGKWNIWIPLTKEQRDEIGLREGMLLSGQLRMMAAQLAYDQEHGVGK